MQSNRIVLLAGQWDTTPIVYNFLERTFHVEKVIIEEPVPRKEFIKRRVKKLGMLTVSGQVLFQLLIARPLGKASKKRIKEILQLYNLSAKPIPESEVYRVPSVNAEQVLSQLQQLQPDIVVVHGTRIISKKIFQGVNSTFINIHAGITPRYRGSHGAYWALASNDKENCGVTVHLVDAGIDTGNILYQCAIPVTSKDNFTTYPYLQLAEGLKLLEQAIHSVLQGKATTINNNLNSALWHHPTLWGYLYKRLTRGVK